MVALNRTLINLENDKARADPDEGSLLALQPHKVTLQMEVDGVYRPITGIVSPIQFRACDITPFVASPSEKVSSKARGRKSAEAFPVRVVGPKGELCSGTFSAENAAAHLRSRAQQKGVMLQALKEREPDQMNLFCMYHLRGNSSTASLDSRNLEFGDTFVAVTDVDQFLSLVTARLAESGLEFHYGL